MRALIPENNSDVPDPLAPLGVTSGASKILGLINFSSDLEIPTAFAKTLDLSCLLSAFISVSNSHMFGLDLRFSNKGLGKSQISQFATPTFLWMMGGG